MSKAKISKDSEVNKQLLMNRFPKMKNKIDFPARHNVYSLLICLTTGTCLLACLAWQKTCTVRGFTFYLLTLYSYIASRTYIHTLDNIHRRPGINKIRIRFQYNVYKPTHILTLLIMSAKNKGIFHLRILFLLF